MIGHLKAKVLKLEAELRTLRPVRGVNRITSRTTRGVTIRPLGKSSGSGGGQARWA